MMARDEALVLENQDALSGDIAGTYKKQDLDGVEPRQADLEAFDRDGYVVLKGLLDPDRLNQIEAATRDLLGPTGRNSFEGFKTQRAYALLAKSRQLDILAAHPQILGFLKARLHPEPLLSAFLAINIRPGEDQQIPHYDDGFYNAPRPGPVQGLSVIWALDPFTPENGATKVWPGSHIWPNDREPIDADPAAQAVMEAGDAIVFNGALRHAGGANLTEDTFRLAVTAQYCAPWLRTQENMSLAVPPETVAMLADPLPSLLGYQIHPPFMGHVNGMHPRRLFYEDM
jgi:ectoine hydroxylase-related dioxygenase (phytanoyl-CoA dioxygenase family)